MMWLWITSWGPTVLAGLLLLAALWTICKTIVESSHWLAQQADKNFQTLGERLDSLSGIEAERRERRLNDAESKLGVLTAEVSRLSEDLRLLRPRIAALEQKPIAPVPPPAAPIVQATTPPPATPLPRGSDVMMSYNRIVAVTDSVEVADFEHRYGPRTCIVEQTGEVRIHVGGKLMAIESDAGLLILPSFDIAYRFPTHFKIKANLRNAGIANCYCFRKDNPGYLKIIKLARAVPGNGGYILDEMGEMEGTE